MSETSPHNTRGSGSVIRPRAELEIMTRDELLKYSLQMNDLCSKLLSLEKRVDELESEQEIQRNVNTILNKEISAMKKRAIQNEKITTNNAQYLRRRQLEVNNVDENIHDDRLTDTITGFLSVTGVTVKTCDIDKCHRMKSKTTVIMEFKSRQLRDSVLMKRSTMKNKRKESTALGLGKSYISESLCNEFHRLSYICRRLKRDRKINDTWYFNGRLYVVDLNKEKIQIEHLVDTYRFATEDDIDNYLAR